MGTETSAIAEFAASLRFDDLPASVVASAQRCVLDTLGCILGGAQTTPGRVIADVLREHGGRAEATVVPDGDRLSAPSVAMIHATRANALDYDDTLFGHPGAPVISAVLAAAEAMGASGQDCLAAIVVGYDISARAMACRRPRVPRYEAVWDLGTLQAYGVAAAVGRLRGLKAPAIEQALGIVGATAPTPLGRKDRTLQQAGRSMIKSAYGWTAQAGMLAPELADRGFTGPQAILDGTMGFWEPVKATGAPFSSLTGQLGKVYAIEATQFKPYPACRFLHPALDALRSVHERQSLRPDEIAQIEVEGFALLGDAYHNIPRPASITDAQFSVPFVLASFVLDGELRPEAFTESRLADPRVAALTSLVTVRVDEEHEARFPERLGTTLTVRLRDGRLLQQRTDVPRGSPERPLTDHELEEKFRLLTRGTLSDGQAARAIAEIRDFPDKPTVQPLIAALIRGPQ